ncbi:hypothetical protein C8R47DRAFT_1281763 [Mycena vitilis]|nr:hypothetical protein C8R47DRAFT_1281763 [Mycena vitilis]
MHCALQILVILDLICQQTAQKDVIYGRNPELASLARTAKMFLDPALNALWREQETICNLLRCMPDDLWRISARGGVYSQRLGISQLRTITAADWQRPLFYLRRVRYFSMRAVIETPDFLDALSMFLPVDYLFPNLEGLDWHPLEAYADAGYGFHHIHNIETIADLSVFSNLAPSNLPVRETPLHRSYPASAPSLTILTVKSDAPLSVSLLSQSEYKPFPALRILTVPSILGAAAFLNRFPGCSLESLSIVSGQSHSTKDHARQFYSALVNHCSHFSLQRWRGEVTPIQNEQHMYAVGGDIIEPLFSFANLTSHTPRDLI